METTSGSSGLKYNDSLFPAMAFFKSSFSNSLIFVVVLNVICRCNAAWVAKRSFTPSESLSAISSSNQKHRFGAFGKKTTKSPMSFFELLAPSFIWQHVLDCFLVHDALLVDTAFGNPQKDWLISQRLSAMSLTNDSWSQCMKYRQLGLALYLKSEHVSCVNLDAMVQWACDHRIREFLVLWTTPEFIFHDCNNQPIRSTYVPHLDHAIDNNDTVTVAYVLHRFGTTSRRLIRSPPVCIQRIVMGQNTEKMFHLLIPKVLKITTIAPLLTALEAGQFHMVHLALNYSDPDILTDKIQIAAAKAGDLSIYQRVTTRCCLEAYHIAIAYGRTEVVRYIQSLQPDYVPSESSLVAACEYGHLEVLQLLPDTLMLPHGCLEASVKCADARVLVWVVRHIQKPKFPAKLLSLAIRSGHECTIATLYTIGLYHDLTDADRLEMVQKDQGRLMQALHELKLSVYSEKVFLEAAKVCNHTILQHILENSTVFISQETMTKAFQLAYVSPSSQRTLVCSYLNDKKGQMRESAPKMV
jgi:hypothetical protein